MACYPLRCTNPACQYQADYYYKHMMTAALIAKNPPKCPRCGALMEKRPATCAAIFPEGRGGFYKPSKGAGAKEEK